MGAKRSERDVGADAERQHRALGLAILWKIREAGANGVVRRTDINRLALDCDRTAGEFAEAEQTLHRLGSARADEAIEADDLTGVKLERDPVEFGGVGNVIRFEHDRAQLHCALGIDLTNRATHHEADEIGLSDVGDGAGADLFAVA